MKNFLFTLVLILNFLTLGANELTLEKILEKVDNITNAPKDQTIFITITLIDKNKDQSIRKITMYQKGQDKRVGKFTYPKEQKGLGFLSLPGNIMHIYLPAYKKIKNITSQSKNGSFSGTDFTYEDMEMSSFARDYTGKILNENDSLFLLELFPKKEKNSFYEKLLITVDKRFYIPIKIEFFEKGKCSKILERKKIEKIKSYYVAKEMIMKNIENDHQTIMNYDSIFFDTNLSDDIFTDRFLKEQ
ncbi:MAG: outer membrane lipoprotein-sorting protein [candidate division WOR-3 bacterium]